MQRKNNWYGNIKHFFYGQRESCEDFGQQHKSEGLM